MDNKTDKKVISKFVEYLRQWHPDLTINYYPDEIFRNNPEIDAIADPFAIEHTSLNTYEEQRLIDAKYGGLFSSIVNELNPIIPYRLRITVKNFTGKKDQIKKNIKTLIEEYLIYCTPFLKDNHVQPVSIAGVPFSFDIYKSTSRKPGITFLRYDPEEDESFIINRIQELFNSKFNKLKKYKLSGKTTLLLVQSSDAALISPEKLKKLILESYINGLPSGIDQIWIAYTPEPDNVMFLNSTPNFRDTH